MSGFCEWGTSSVVSGPSDFGCATTPADFWSKLSTPPFSIHISGAVLAKWHCCPDHGNRSSQGRSRLGVVVLQLIRGGRTMLDKPSAGTTEIAARERVSDAAGTVSCPHGPADPGTVVCLRKGECAGHAPVGVDTAGSGAGGRHRDEGMSTVE
jgi:hypothetical protein